MTTVTQKNQLLDKAEGLNKTLENSYLALSLVLVEVEETEAYKEAGYEDFPSYYKEALGREKSTVSRLLQVGRWLRDNKMGLPTGNLSYKKLGSAIKAFPNETPEKVLAIAETWTPEDFKDEKKEDGHAHEYEMFCKHCWRKK